MNCIYLRKRVKKGELYLYCFKIKKVINYENCGNCEFKDYKTIKALNKRTNRLAKAEKERFSIIYRDLSKCAECGSINTIELNEVYEGSYRQLSIKYGMVVPLCHECHQRFHEDRLFALKYKAMFMKEFLKSHTEQKFIKIFKKNYIYLYQSFKGKY